MLSRLPSWSNLHISSTMDGKEASTQEREERERAAARARQRLAEEEEDRECSAEKERGSTIYMTQSEAASFVAERVSLLQQWRNGDVRAGQQFTEQERARIQTISDKKTIRMEKTMPAISESLEQQEELAATTKEQEWKEQKAAKTATRQQRKLAAGEATKEEARELRSRLDLLQRQRQPPPPQQQQQRFMQMQMQQQQQYEQLMRMWHYNQMMQQQQQQVQQQMQVQQMQQQQQQQMQQMQVQQMQQQQQYVCVIKRDGSFGPPMHVLQRRHQDGRLTTAHGRTIYLADEGRVWLFCDASGNVEPAPEQQLDVKLSELTVQALALHEGGRSSGRRTERDEVASFITTQEWGAIANQNGEDDGTASVAPSDASYFTARWLPNDLMYI